MGRFLIIVLGLPSLVSGVYLAWIAYNGFCIKFLIGPIQCGPSIYIYSFLGTLFFFATLWLAHIWSD